MSYDLEAALDRVEGRQARTGIFEGSSTPSVELEHDDPRVLLCYAGMDVDAREVERKISQLVAAYMASLATEGAIELEAIDDNLIAALKGLAGMAFMFGWEVAQ